MIQTPNKASMMLAADEDTSANHRGHIKDAAAAAAALSPLPSPGVTA